MNISKQLINGFIQTELEQFKMHFDEYPVSENHDERSLSIAWVCYYFKPLISKENTEQIIDFIHIVSLKNDYSKHGWYRISALQSAAFILTTDLQYANILVQHLDCGQSWARSFIVKSVSIICPLLAFENQYLKKATELNLYYSHALCEENAILYLSTVGSADEKKAWLSNRLFEDENDHHKKFFMELKQKGEYKSGFFIRIFSNAKSYFIFKIMSQPTLAEMIPSLFDNNETSFAELLTKEKAHPLNDYDLDLSFLRDQKV